MFLFFSLNLLFFNQFNGIRQYIAVYIVVYALVILPHRKSYKFIFLILFSSLFHKSSIFFIIFIFLKNLLCRRFSKKIIFILIFLVASLYFTNLATLLNKILLFIPSYQNYIGIDYLNKLSFAGVLTKLLKLWVVIISMYLIDEQSLDKKYIYLVNLSYLAILLMVFSFSSGILWRFYQYLDFFIAIPVLLLFNKKKYVNLSILISIYLIFILIFKIIIFPTGEYKYNSILMMHNILVESNLIIL